MLTLLLGGCSAPKKNEVPIRAAISDDITSLDAAGTKDVLSETVGRCVFSTLYIFDENLNMVPCLVKEAEQISELEWVFTICGDVKFHDGSTLTAYDAAFSLKRAQTVAKADQFLRLLWALQTLTATVTIRSVQRS